MKCEMKQIRMLALGLMWTCVMSLSSRWSLLLLRALQ